jgi:hypothetical protein
MEVRGTSSFNPGCTKKPPKFRTAGKQTNILIYSATLSYMPRELEERTEIFVVDIG